MAKLIPWLFLLPPALVTVVAIVTVLHRRTPKGRALAHFRAGGDFVHNKALESAETEFKSGLALWPDHGPMLGSMASVLVGLERHEDALVFIEKARAADPGDHRLSLMEGRCHQSLGDADKAISVWEAIPEDSDVYVDAMGLVAGEHEARGDLNAAIGLIEKAIEKGSSVQRRPYKAELKRLKAALESAPA